MKLIFLAAAFGAVFFTALLFQKKPRALHDTILITWMIYFGVYIGIYAIYSHELFVHFHLLSISLLSLLLLPGPFLYCYILILVTGRKHLVIKDFLHLVPLITFNLYLLIASFSAGLPEELNIEMIGPGYNPPAFFMIFLIMTALSGPVYFLVTIRLFRKLDINIFNYFSNSADMDLYWIRRLVLVFGIIWTALIAITVIHHIFHLFSMAFCTDGLFLSLSAFVMLIGYFGLTQKIIYGGEELSVTENSSNFPTKYSGSRLSDAEASQLVQQLKEHFDRSKTYLNPDLTLSHLANELGISSHILSQVINEQFKLNFFDMVNSYRVEEFKKRIASSEYSNFSLLGIALECGFNSKSSFNRIFKKATGLTPSGYKDSVS
jgi:AraC-like DNA-binding protein